MSPLDNVKYHESAVFLARTEPDKALRDELRRHFWNFPDSGVEVCGGVKTLEFRGHTIVFRRVKRQHWLSVLFIYTLPGEQADYAATLKQLRKLYCNEK